MFILLSNITFTLPELLLIAIIPILLILTTIIYLAVSDKQLKDLKANTDSVEQELSSLENYDMEQIAVLEEAANQLDNEELKASLLRLIESGKKKYDAKWLPDPQDELKKNTYLGNALSSALNPAMSLIVFSIGLISSFALLIISIINPELIQVNKIFFIIPLLIGILTAAFLLNQRNVLAKKTAELKNQLSDAIAYHYPVYTDKSGIALLVNQMTDHEDHLNSAMNEFNQHIEKFVSEDFKEAVGNSIKEIMEQEVAPPINKSAEVLSDLATSLTEQQNEGMAELADAFSEKLNHVLAENFQNVTSELNSFNALMEDTTNFIHDSIAILENSRQQNILLNREISESIELMAVAKNDIANEMAEMSDYLEVIAKVTQEMTSVYAGEDANLKEQIASLKDAMKSSLTTINESIYQSQATISLSNQMRDSQDQNYKETIEKMNTLLQNLDAINKNISASTEKFAVGSEEKIDHTLKGFEEALANIVERLIYTTAEIKDAVEGLPLAMQSKKE